MSFKALLLLVPLATSNLLAAGDVCRFPPDYLISDPHSMVQPYISDIVYVYTDPFANCSGCVREISVCYFTFSDPNNMLVFIVDEESTIVHTHSFVGPETNTDNPSTECVDYESFSVCCSNQSLSQSEQFAVWSSEYYGVWSQQQMAIHGTLRGQGHYVTQALTLLEVGQNINSSTYDLEKIFFHFVITPGSCESHSVFIPATSADTLTSSSALHSVIPSNYATPQYSLSYTVSTTENTHSPNIPPTLSSSTTSVSDVGTTSGVGQSATTHTPLHTTPSPHISPTTSPNTIESGSSSGSAVSVSTIVAASTAGAVLVISILLATLVIYLAVKSRARTSKKAYSSTNPQENQVHFSSSLQEVNINPSYATSNLQEVEEIQFEETEILCSLQDNPSYGSPTQATGKPKATKMSINPAYSSSGSAAQRDGIYSYVADNEDGMKSWRSSTNVPTSPNEAYTSLRSGEMFSLEMGGGDDGKYVANSLVYETVPDDMKMVGATRSEAENEFDGLVLTDVFGNMNRNSGPENMALNAAYIAVNHTTSDDSDTDEPGETQRSVRTT